MRAMRVRVRWSGRNFSTGKLTEPEDTMLQPLSVLPSRGWQVQVEGRGASLPGTGANAGAPPTSTDTTRDQRRPRLPGGLIRT